MKLIDIITEAADIVDGGFLTINEEVLKNICTERDRIIEDLQRNCEILARNALPENCWAAPNYPTNEMAECGPELRGDIYRTTAKTLYVAMRQAHLKSREEV